MNGRQIFEKKKLSDEAENDEDEDAQLIDLSKFSREESHTDEEDETEEHLVLSDSD